MPNEKNRQKISRVSINGVLLLDKPVRISSHFAVKQVQKIFNAKKAGHTGSLDVLASGMLPICLGEATKFSSYLLEANKSYRVTAKLGERTTTCDAEGEIIEKKSTENISAKLLQEVLSIFKGEIKQIPSMFSALKHKGQPLYKLARKGIEVDRPSRSIHIYELTLVNWNNDEMTLDVCCSKGTYIRNLVDDIGKALGCGAYVLELRRLSAGYYKEAQMISLESLRVLVDSDDLCNCLLPIDSMLIDLPRIELTQEEVKSLYFGQLVSMGAEHKEGELFRLYDEENRLLGVGKINSEGFLHAKRLVQRVDEDQGTKIE